MNFRKDIHHTDHSISKAPDLDSSLSLFLIH
jgi:hypothetical protein